MLLLIKQNIELDIDFTALKYRFCYQESTKISLKYISKRASEKKTTTKKKKKKKNAHFV